MIDEQQNPWVTQTEDLVYDNPWISVTHRNVQTPGGTAGIYGVVHFKNYAVGIVPIDSEGYTWLVGQFRYPLNAYSWEIPEGGCPLGTDPLETAKRELKEETGLIAGCWQALQEFALSNSVSDERGIVYLATELTHGLSSPEETEQLQVRRLPFSEALNMVYSGSITDAISIMGLLRADQVLQQSGR